ncbi:MAG: flagellar filament capping protein FliD, partial [bacterium]|nr:flagellar filament capping protein FliD [bacterium]
RFTFILPEKMDVNDTIVEFLCRSVKKEEKQEGRLFGKNIGDVSIRDLVISGADFVINKISKIMLPVQEEAWMKVKSDKAEEMMILLSPGLNWTNVSRVVKDLKNIQSLEFCNNSSSRYYIDNLKLISRGESKKVFKNVAHKPEDARLKVDDVEVKRDKNENLNDIIKGVNLTLNKTSPGPVKMSVKMDTEVIEKKLDDFIAQYNTVITYILEAGKTSKSTKPGTTEKAEKGALSNDMALMNLNSKLRSTIVNSYSTSLGDKLAILSQIGVSTGRWGATWENIRKGLLELDKEKFQTAMNQFEERVGEIFGYDSNKDKIIDTGVAYELDKVLKGYIQSKGVIDGKIALLESLVKNKDKDIASKEDSLGKYEENLRTKFTKMQRGLQGLKGTSQALENQIKNLPSQDTTKKDKEE